MGNGTNVLLRESLLRRLPNDRVFQILEVLRPIYLLCEQHPFPFGDRTTIPAGLSYHIQTIIQLPCTRVDPIPRTYIPQRLLTGLQSTSLVTRTKFHLMPTLLSTIDQASMSNITYDFMQGFGFRPPGVLPPTLWIHIWNMVLLWVFAEIAGDKLEKEAASLEYVARLISSGYIVFDFKPSDKHVALVVCSALPNEEQTYRFR